MLRAEKGQHTLTCGACGAPLRQLKMLPTAASVPKPAISHQPRASKRSMPKPAYVKPSKPMKKRKKRKGFLRKLAEEAFDLVEDIFD